MTSRLRLGFNGAVSNLEARETLSYRQIWRSRRRHPARERKGNPPCSRGQCLQVARPCPFVGCRYHLFLDAKENGSVQFPHSADVAALADMAETCALDVAADGAQRLDDCADLLGLSRERIRQLEEEAFAKLKAEMTRRGIDWQAGDTAEIDANVGRPDTTLKDTAAHGQEEALWLQDLWNIVDKTQPT